LAAEAAALFQTAEVAVQPAAAHFPWIDDLARFTTALAAFLAFRSARGPASGTAGGPASV
jgi:hypothetical protein